MPKGRSKIGAARKLTRNQQRKRDYAEMREKNSRGVKYVEKARVRLVGERGLHRASCGNIACRPCFRDWYEQRERAELEMSERRARRALGLGVWS